MRSLVGVGMSCVLGASVQPAAAQEPSQEIQEVVVVGSRGSPRLALESMSPIDLIDGQELRASGFTDLGRALQFAAPSVDFPRSATAPSAANTRGVTLRGLSPDQVLVLVDGKRRHASSVLNFNNVVGRGTVPVDLNTIPVAAVERIEILRDGAAPQYGSDAIAGVINVVLRKDPDRASSALQVGVAEDGDGETVIAQAGGGLTLGDSGHLVLTGESRYRDFTNGAGVDSRYGRVTNRQGDPESLDIGLVASARIDLDESSRLYANSIVSRRGSQSAAQFRSPGVSPLHPDGFLPLIELEMLDAGATFGFERSLGKWMLDFSDTFGWNRADFEVRDSANTSLAALSPTRFDAGGTRYLQNLLGATASRSFGVLSGATLAIGLESRYEAFEIVAGEPASLAGAGAQGFPGFNPPRRIDEDRHAFSAFIDGELATADSFTLGGAVRYEKYSDVDAEVTGKLSALYRPLEPLALRVTASTGLRAPSLQQEYFSTVSSQSTAGVLVNVGTYAVDDPVARALGADPLRPETSRQLSAGIVLTPSAALRFSIDVFHVDIDDRIILSESLRGPEVGAVLAAAGITNVREVRFFTNAADTRTRGFEVMAGWRGNWLSGGRSDVTLGYMATDTDLRRVDSNPLVPSLPLLGLKSIDLLTEAQPRDKLSLHSTHRFNDWRLRADVTRFGEFRSAPVLTEQTFGAVTTLDVAVDYDFSSGWRLSAGVLNATDAYPDKIAERALFQGGSVQYSEGGGLGADGREYYLRVALQL